MDESARPLAGQSGGVIDQISFDILRALRENGRISIAALAQEVGISRASAYSRIEALTKAGATVLGYGAFLTAVVQFLLLAFVIFWLIRIVTIVRKKIEEQAAKLLADKEAEQKAEEAAKPAPVPSDVQLLQEIRDLLKEKKAAQN